MGGRRGFAMVGALLALVVATLFTATLADLGRGELVIARNEQRAAVALAALDGCTAVVLRALPLGWWFDDVLAGPDGVGGTLDDGALPTPAGCVGTATAVAAAAPRLRVVLEASRGGGRRRGEAIVGRAATPGPAALLWLPDGARAGLVAGTLALDGAAGDGAWAGLAAASEPSVLDLWASRQPGHVRTTPSTPAPIWSPAPPVAALVVAARAAAAVPAEAALGSDPTLAPALGLADGRLTIASPRWARGILIVAGRLEVHATLDVDGLLVVGGGVHVAPGALLRVRGAVWSDTRSAAAFDVWGSAHVRRDPGALATGANMLTLPHEPRLVAWRDR